MRVVDSLLDRLGIVILAQAIKGLQGAASCSKSDVEMMQGQQYRYWVFNEQE